MNSNNVMFWKLHSDFRTKILEDISAKQISMGNSAITEAEFKTYPCGIQNMLLETELFSLAISLVYSRMLHKADSYRKLAYRQFANFVVAENFDGDLSHKTRLSGEEQKKIRTDILAIWEKGL